MKRKIPKRAKEIMLYHAIGNIELLKRKIERDSSSEILNLFNSGIIVDLKVLKLFALTMAQKRIRKM